MFSKKILMLLLAPLALYSCTYYQQPERPAIFTSPDSAAASQAGTSEFHARRTLSSALDRIDQRSATPDGQYKHFHTGKGVTVYVFDGGISNHPEMAGRVRLGFIGFSEDTVVCNDHGTAVASAIAGTTLGVAPEATIVDVRMISCKTLHGTLGSTRAAVRWVLQDHRAHPGPAIANWSFDLDNISGHDQDFEKLIDSLYLANIPVIVSAGNDDQNACDIPPGNASRAINAGSTSLRHDQLGYYDERTPNTAYGECITLYAPGDSVLEADSEAGSKLWNGTSMSAAYVSGAAALFLETHPAADPDQVRQHLKKTATVEKVINSKALGRQLMLYVGPKP